MIQSHAAQSPPTTKTGCCIVGAGPAGAVLALLLAKAGVTVTLIEAHRDFDREFRGDTVHPSTLDLLAQLGLAEKTLALSYSRVSSVTLETEEGPFSPLNLEGQKLAFPFIAIIPQARLLELLTHEASRYPNFRLLLSSTVQELVIEEGQVRGVRYTQDRATTELRADVVIAADGRFSKVRKLADIEPTTDGSPMDILWFRLPRESSDGSGLVGRNTAGRALVMIDRGSHWQVGYIIAKGGYQQLRAAGLQKLRSLVPIQKLLRTPLTALGVLTAPRLLRSPITAIGVPRYVSGWERDRLLRRTSRSLGRRRCALSKSSRARLTPTTGHRCSTRCWPRRSWGARTSTCTSLPS
jgi:2-polyprenyl-6-methoxyphenol hydroxylase-like FAD-dependent oxidoreductase